MKSKSDVAITFSLQDYLKGIDPQKKNTLIKNLLARLTEYKETENTITIFFDNIDWNSSDKEISEFMGVASQYDYIFQQISEDDSNREENVVNPTAELFYLHEEPSVVKKFTM